MKHVLALAMLAGCLEPAAMPCDDGLFCPEGTTCGGAGVCLVEEDACAGFPDATPCHLDLGRGFCLAGTCDPGVTVIGATTTFPLRSPPIGVDVTARERPEIVAGVTNINGYFDVVAPRDSRIVLELAYPDALDVVTREIAVGRESVGVDYLYGSIPIVFEDVAHATAASIGKVLDPARGLIVGTTFDEGTLLARIGVQASVDAECDGPYYFDTTGPVSGATETLADGVFVFFDCVAGTAHVAATLAGVPCHTLDVETITIDVEPGKVSFVGRVVCD